MKNKKFLICILSAWIAFGSMARAGTVYVDTAANGSASATFSGSTDTTSATATGTAATVAGTTVTLDVSTNLGTVNTSGSNQTSINIAGATNTNRTIFWITSVTSGCTGTAVACVVVVDTAPTGVTTNAWAVGGRYLWPSGATVDVVVNALRAGDGVIFNTTPASKTVPFISATTAGDSTSGCISISGKVGVRPVLQTTSNSSVIALNQANWAISNLELTTSGTSVLIGNMLGACGADNIKISASGVSANAHGITVNGAGVSITNSEITGVGGDGINSSSGNVYGVNISGNYIHDLTGSCIALTGVGPAFDILGNVLDTCAGRGIFLSGATAVQSHRTNIQRNTIYGNTLAGVEVTDADTVVTLRNNIIMNTNSANIVKWTAGNAQLVSNHDHNVFFSSSSGTLSGLTANSTEFTTNPLFVDAPNANFAISNSSPAAASGYFGSLPLTGTSVGYLDIGAIQRQVTAGGGSTGQLRPGIGQ